MGVIRTKFRPPHFAAPLVARPHLLRSLAGAESPLVVIAAPAGFGKTSLLGQWWAHVADSGGCHAWLTLDKADNDPNRFFVHLISAIRETLAEFGDDVLASIPSEQNLAISAVGDALIDRIAASAPPVTLVLDDAHEIRNADLLDWLHRLMESVSGGSRIVLATRDSAPLRVGRFRAAGRVIEIGPGELALTPDEARRHLEAVGCPPLAPHILASLYRKTEGWAAGLQLASLSLRRIGTREAERFVASFSGSHRDVIDYLGDEVLSALPDDIRQFLVHTSILDRFSAGLCGAVTGRDDCGRLLDRLARSGHFLVPLDSEQGWYRYHQLFSGFLQRILVREDRKSRDALHARASRWLAAEGLADEALDHAFEAGDNEFAAHILNEHCGDLLRFGRTGKLREALERIPKGIRARYARLELTYAWVLAVYWDFARAERIVRGLRSQAGGGAPADAAPRLDRDLLHKEIMLALMTDDPDAANRLVGHWRTGEATQDPYAEASVAVTGIYARGQVFDFANLEPCAERVRALMARAGSDSGRVWADSIIGPIQTLGGDFARARATYVEAIRRGIRVGGRQSFLVAMPSFLLAEVEYLSGCLVRARALVTRHLLDAPHAGFVESFVIGCVQQARLMAADGRPDAALDFLDRVDRDSVPGHFSRLRARLAFERITHALAVARRDRVDSVASEYGLSGNGANFLPGSGSTIEPAYLGLACARLSLAECRYETAIRYLRHWTAFFERRHCIQLYVPAAILLSLASDLAGDPGGAQRAIRPAIRAAAGAGMVQPFVDEGGRIVPLLARFALAAEEAGDPAAGFAHSVVERLNGGAGADEAPVLVPGGTAGFCGAVEQLTLREAEILGLIGKGLTNREVGQYLGISDETVKWHLKQAYPKLGVQRRYRAVSEARRMGLIP